MTFEAGGTGFGSSSFGGPGFETWFAAFSLVSWPDVRRTCSFSLDRAENANLNLDAKKLNFAANAFRKKIKTKLC